MIRGLRDPIGSDQWWRDGSSPFNNFARAYTSIKPGNGNAFAKTDVVDAESGQGHRDGGEGGRSKRRQRRIDILKWEL